MPALDGTNGKEVVTLETTESFQITKQYETEQSMNIISKAANGDMASFEILYEQYSNKVYNVCLRMLKNTSDAQDLTQEVFIVLFRKLHSYRGKSAFSTWLHRLTVNQVLMYFRKRYLKMEQAMEVGSLPGTIVLGSHNPGKMSIHDKIALSDAIAQLPDGYRNVFILHDIEGYEHEEVARILGCSVGTSKSQLHKAHQKLQRLLKNEAPPRLYTHFADTLKENEVEISLRDEYQIEEALDLAELAYEDECF